MTETSKSSSDGAKLRFIVATGFINSLGIGLIQPVLPSLLVELTGQTLTDAAFWGGVALFSYALMQFVFSPIVGALSDRFGRRPVLLISLTALMLDMIMLGLAWSLTVFLIVRALAGVFSATFSTANAYIADFTKPEERGGRFAMLGAAFGAGFIFGPVLGGFLGEMSPRYPFFAAAFMAGLNALYGFFTATESLSQENRRTFDWSRANPFGSITSIGKLPGAGVLLGVAFLATLATWSYVTVWAYVAIDKFDWTEEQVGFSIGYYGVISFVAQAFLVRWMLKTFSVGTVIIIASLAEVFSLTGISFAGSEYMLYAFITMALISSAQDPAVQQELSSRVPANAQGELQGGLSALNSIAIIIAPILYNGLFNVYGGDGPNAFPGAPFLAAAGLTFLALVLYLADQVKRPKKSVSHSETV